MEIMVEMEKANHPQMIKSGRNIIAINSPNSENHF